MAEKDGEHPERSDAANVIACADYAGTSSSDAIPNLTSEALAHLQVNCEQFSAHIKAYIDVDGTCELLQIVDDLTRMRNTLVILEKPAMEFVVGELLVLLNALQDTQRPVSYTHLTLPTKRIV